MQAILHLPNATPRLLTAAELAVLNIQYGSNGLNLDFTTITSFLRELLGTDIPAEVIGCGANYFVIGPENAADYGFSPTFSATAVFERLTGVKLEESLVGPLLIIEA